MRNRRSRQVATDEARFAEDAAADEPFVGHLRVSFAKFTAKLESVLALRPTDRVTVGPERRGIACIGLITEGQNSERHVAVGIAGIAIDCSQLGKHRISVDIEPEILLCRGVFYEWTDHLARRTAEPDARFVDEIRRERRREVRCHDLRAAVRVTIHTLRIRADSSSRKCAVAIGQFVRVGQTEFVPFVEVVIESAVDLSTARVGTTEWRALNRVATAVSVPDPSVSCGVEAVTIHNGCE